MKKHILFFFTFFVITISSFANPDISISSTFTGSADGLPGAEILYTIRVDYDGVPIADYKITDIISNLNLAPPTNITSNSSGGADPGTPTVDSNGNFSVTGIDFTSGTAEFVEYTYTTTIDDDFVGSIINTATLTDSVDASITSDNDSITSLDPISITKTSTDNYYTENNTLNYTLTIENPTNTKIDNVSIIDDFDITGLTGAEIISVSTTGTDTDGVLGTGSLTNNEIDITTAIIGPNGSITYEISGTVPAGTTSTIVNNASASYKGITKNDSISHDPISINFTYTSPTNTYDNGDKVNFQISISNPNNYEITNLEILNDFNGFGLTNLEVQVNESGPNTNGVITTGPLAGDEIDIPNATLGPLGSIIYFVEGTVDATQSDPIITNTEVNFGGMTETTTITHNRVVYDYSLSKTMPVSQVIYSPGQEITYEVYLENNANNVVKGLDIADLISGLTIETTTGTGPAFDPATIVVMANTTGTGSASGLPSNPYNGDLNVTNAVIGPNGSIKYTITGTVNLNAVGDIKNTATVTETTRSNNIKQTPEITLPAGSPIMLLNKSVNKTTNYMPGDPLIYTLTVTNAGAGYGEEFTVRDLVTSLTTNLSSDPNDSESSLDIVGSPFDSTSVEVVSIGDNSLSNYTIGSPQINVDLIDNVFVSPGESITYKISTIVNEVSIGDIENSFNLSGTTLDTNSDLIITTPQPLNTDLDSVEIIKTTTLSEYEPGDEVTYDIHITNTDPNKSVNDFNLVDLISQIEAEQISGLSGPAFSSWKLEVIDPTSSTTSTKPGTPITSTLGTTDVNINVDLAPSDTVSYRLTAVVSPTTIGQIKDDTSSGADNVIETGEGLLMSSPKLAISKTVDTSEYSPTKELVYTIVVENSGLGYAINLPIIDALSSVITSTGDTAYSTWSITSKLEKSPGGTLNPTGNSGIVTEPLVDQDLDVLASIGPESQLIYTIKATVDGKATGIIKNEVSADGTLVADKGSFPMEPKVSAGKSVNRGTYSALDGTNTFVYEILISNDEDAGYAKDIKVFDDLSAIDVELLNGGTLTDAFENISVTTELSGDGTTSLNNPTGALGNGILEDTVNITADGYVKYTITADLKVDFSADNIPYKDIINKGTVTPTDINGVQDTPIEINATSSPKQPDLKITKSTPNVVFANDGTVTYTVLVENDGDGYAYNAKVTDSLDTNAFASWTITERTDGDLGDVSYRGSNSDLLNAVTNDTNLDALVNIKPKGFVEYTIVAKVKSDYAGDDILNTAEVFDEQSQNSYTSSVSLGRIDKGLYTTKTVDQLEHTPGSPLTYTVTVFNTSNSDVDFGAVGCYVVDKFSDMSVTLANDGTNPITDQPNQFPFTNMTWTGQDALGGNTDSGNITENTDFRHQPTIPANSSYVYTITVDVKDNVLPSKIRNTALIEEAGQEFGQSLVETNPRGDYGGTSRDVDDKYIPGQPITYTITVDGGDDGYLNDEIIDEKINDIQVLLLDGTMGNPFYDPASGTNLFTVNMVRTNANGDPISSGTSDPNGHSNNNDISEVVDIAPGDIITYTVTGVIRPDADGDINYKGLVTEPYRHNLELSKIGSPTAYIPNQTISFDIIIDNNSQGNAKDIVITDVLSALEVDLVDGTTGSVFVGDSWTITPTISQSPAGTEDYTSYATTGTVSTDTDINTQFNLPIHTRVTYTVTGIVNPLAIGTIRNTATIDGDKVTGEIGPARPGLIGSKVINAYYDRTDTLYASSNDKYQPGGWIEYYLILENKGDGFFNDFPVSDMLSEIKTTYVDGSQGPAYSTWVIDKVEETGIGTDAGIGLNYPLTDVDLVETPTTDPDQRQLLIDISPGGKIVISIKAKVHENSRGDIENIAYSRTSFRSSGVSTMLDPDVVLEKVAYNPDGSVKTEFLVGDTFYYEIKVKNNGLGTSIGKFEDLLSSIKTQIPGNGSPTGDAYASWTITAQKSNDNEGSWTIGDTDGVTTLDNFESPNNIQNDVDINSPNIVIASGGVLEYRVDVTLVDNALSAITNTVTYEDQTGDEDDNTTITPPSPSIALTKEIIDINGTSYVDGNTYKPEDIITYKITVTNTGDAFANNIRIRDRISNLRAEVAGGGDQLPFSTWTVESDGGLDSRSFVQTKYLNPSTVIDQDLNSIIDLAPSDVMTFTVTATIKENLVGDIPINTVEARDTKDSNKKLDEENSGPVPQANPDINYHKSFYENRMETTAFEYVPFGDIIYKITVTNNGDGYGNDIIITDLLKDVVDDYGSGDPAFTAAGGVIQITDKDGNVTVAASDTNNVVIGTSTGLNSLDALIDIEPGAEIVFFLQATVVGTATGDITNTVTVKDPINGTTPTITSGQQDNVTATLSNADVRLLKTGDVRYSPGQPAKYQVTIENYSNSTAEDVVINDIFKNLMVETVDGTFKPAFKSHSTNPWTITAVVSDDRANSDISELLTQINNDPENSIDNVSIILGTKSTTKVSSKVIIDFEATVIDDAVGNIFNRASVDYNGDNITADHFILPALTTIDNIDLTKRAVVSEADDTDVTEYTPGNTQTFLVEVTNNNDSYALDVNIKDDIASLLTSGAGSFAISGGSTNEISTFDSSTITTTYQVFDSTGNTPSTLSVVKNIDLTTGFEADADLAPGDILRIWITAKINEEVMLPITNTVDLEFKTETKDATDDVNPPTSNVTVTKQISSDGATYSTGPIKYDTGDTIYYRILLENTSNGWANDIRIIDDISTIEALKSGGGDDLVYDEANIRITIPEINNESNKYILYDPTASNLRAIFDMAPNSTLEFDIEADTNSNIVGDIDNTASVSLAGTDVVYNPTNTVTAEPNLLLNNDIVLTKEVIGGQTDYTSGETIRYLVTVANNGINFAHDLRIIDEVINIQVDSSQNAGLVDAFDSFTVGQPMFNAPTNIISSDYTNGINALVDLAPNDTISFEITAKIIDTAVGDITNSANYEYNGSTSPDVDVTLVPKKADLSILKTTTTPLGIPSGTAEYTVIIRNTGEGIANNIDFKDEISKIVTEISDGLVIGGTTTGKAFVDNSIVATVETAVGTFPTTPVLIIDTSTNATNNDISSSFDLDPNGYLEIKITGTLVDNIVDEITNTASFEFINNGDTVPTSDSSDAVFDIANANIVLEKLVIVDPDVGGYLPGEDIEYTITVTNNGLGIADNIAITDLLSAVEVNTLSGLQPAFSTWSIDLVNSGTVSTTNLPSTYPDDTDLDIIADIGPGDTIQFNITAKAITDAFDDITNTASVQFENDKHNDEDDVPQIDSDATIIPSRSEVTISKTADLSEYAPGDRITYRVKLENLGPGIAKSVKFNDTLPFADSSNNNGTDHAFDYTTGSIEDIIILGGATEDVPLAFNGNALFSTITLPRGGSVEYVFSGEVASNIVGDIDNTASFVYTDNDGTDKFGEDTASTIPKNARVTILKEVDKLNYIAGEELTYTITLENTGSGIANDVKVIDNILDIQALSSNGTNINAFDSVTITDNAGNLLSPISSIDPYDTDKNLDVLVDIAPNDKVIFTLVGIVADSIVGEVLNTATYDFTHNDGTNSTYNSEAISKPNNANLEIKKEVDKLTYTPGEELTYTITIKNIGDGIANDIDFKDEISKIITEISDGLDSNNTTNGKAFVDNSIVASVENAIGTFPATPILTIDTSTNATNNDISSNFDLYPNGYIEIKIVGTLVDNIVGEVTNTASYNFTHNDGVDDGTNSGSDDASSNSENAGVTILKEVDKLTYAPGEDLTYTIIVKNTGTGIANNIKFKDEISQIITELSDGLDSNNTTNGKAFVDNSIIASVENAVGTFPTIPILAIDTSTNTTNNNVSSNFDLYPNGYIEIKIVGTLVDNIVGEITNTASYTYTDNDGTDNFVTDSAITDPKNAELVITKTADSILVPGQPHTYTVSIKNNGEGIADDVEIIDNILDIQALSSYGPNINAFDSVIITDNAGSLLNPISSIDSYDTDKNLDVLVDIAPNDEVIFTLVGVVADSIVGEVLNTATYDFTHNDGVDDGTNSGTSTVSSTSSNAVLLIEKTVDKSNYVAGEDLTYTITIKNTGTGIANDIQFKDEISQIITEISDGLDSDNTTNGKTFVDNSIIASVENAVGTFPTIPILTIDTSTNTNNDVSSNFDLYPNGYIEIKIIGTLVDNIVGEVTNIASYDFTNNDGTNDINDASVTTQPSNANVEITKTVDKSNYIAGEDLTYTITLENTGTGIANDVDIIDNILDIMGTSSNGNSINAFTKIIISHSSSYSTNISTEPVYDIDKNLNTSIDLAPTDKITFTIVATTDNSLVGEIINTASYNFTNNDGTNDTNDASVTTQPSNANISITKTVDKLNYVAGEDLTYTVILENTGTGIANDVNVIDNILDIMATSNSGTDIPAFTNVTITDNSSTLNSPSLINTYDPNTNLTTSIDIAPNDKVIFTIVATTDNSLVGEIINTASYDFINNDGTDNAGDSEAISKPSNANVEITKEVDKLNYINGEELTYTITLENTGSGIANDVNIIDNILDIQALSSAGGNIQAITNITITDNSSTLNSPSFIDTTYDHTANLSTLVDIAPNDKVVFTIVGIVADSLVGEILNTATYDFINNDGTPDTDSAEAISNPSNAKLDILKTSVDVEFIPGEQITYEVILTNTGTGIANDVTLTDDILDILVKSVYGDDINAFTDVIITDNSSTLNPISTVQPYDTDKNLNVVFDLVPGDTIIFTLVATTDRLVGEDITGRADFEFVNNDGTNESGYSEFTSKVKLNQGELVLTKRALKSRIEKGEMVEYEILVRNNNASFFTGVEVIDDTPAGFSYVNGSTEMTLSTDDSLDDNNDVFYTDNPSVGDVLTFKGVNIAPKEILRIRYVLRANIGTTFGEYVNTAHAYGSGRVVSNYDSASVEIIPSALFDTGTIIGKVFEDLNGDGYQADATATGISVIGATAPGRYIPNSTTLTTDGETVKLKDASSPLEKGIEVGSLRGISLNRDLKQHSKAIIRYEATDSTWEPITLTTDDGTHITMDEKGNITEDHKDKVSKDLANEKIKITRNTYQLKDSPNYLQEIIIENFGIYEDGIPGVRLITVEGYVIDTDEFGRYHVPDQWITSSIGSNFIVKVDPDSLPQGMEVISENPRVRRITSSSLNRFNFSVQREADNFEVKNEDEVNRIGGKEDE